MIPDPTGREPLARPAPASAEPAKWWTWPTFVGFVLVAVGFGTWLAFASEQADRENSGEIVSAGITAAVMAGGVFLLGGFIVLVLEGVRRGRKERRLVRRIAGEIGLGLAGIVVGFLLMLTVVEIAFG